MKDHPNAVYIGRAMPRQGLKASKWANPYKVSGGRPREDAISLYGYDLCFGDKLHLLAELPELRGKTLACWCSPEPCHGDVLVSLLDLHTDDELRAMAKEWVPA